MHDPNLARNGVVGAGRACACRGVRGSPDRGEGARTGSSFVAGGGEGARREPEGARTGSSFVAGGGVGGKGVVRLMSAR
jgi:hypothetical protein